MSDSIFDPDATIDERHLAPPSADRPAARPPAPATPASPDPDATYTGDETVDEWRPRHGVAPRAPAPVGGATVAQKSPVRVRPCPHCRSLIDASAVLCPLCRKATGKRAVPEGAVAIIAAVVVVLVALYFVWDWVGG